MPRTGEIIRDLTGQPILDLAGEYLRDLSDNVYLDFVPGQAAGGGSLADVVYILNGAAGSALAGGSLANVSLDVVIWASVGRADAAGAHTLFIVIPSLRTAHLAAGGARSDVQVGLNFVVGNSSTSTARADVAEIVNGGDGRAVALGLAFAQNWSFVASVCALRATGWAAGVHPTVEVKLARLLLSTLGARVRFKVGHAASGVRIMAAPVPLPRSTGDILPRVQQVPEIDRVGEVAR